MSELDRAAVPVPGGSMFKPHPTKFMGRNPTHEFL